MFIERILLATDGSDLALRAAQVAILLAGTGARRLVAFSVAQPRMSLPAEAIGTYDAGAELRRALDAAHAHVETVARLARQAGLACDTLVRISSAPGREIVRAAQEQRCDLVVMGAHGPADANPLLTGSVAQHVLGWSTVPVLVLRDPGEAAPPGSADVPGP